MSKLIITAALTGAEATRADNPAVPYTPEEIAADAYACWQAGASIVHIHARHSDGTPTQDGDTYEQIIKAIREKCDVIIQVSTGGAVGMSPRERLQPVYRGPDMATLSTGTVNFADDVFMNTPTDIEAFAKAIKAQGVKPEVEVFDAGMINNALGLVKKGLLSMPLHFDFVLGVPGALPGTPESLMFLRSQIPRDCTWTVAGIGRAELPLGAMSIAMGGHVRVGLEDNIYYRKGELATGNRQLVERMVRIARELEREVATPEETRAILNIGRN
ncbi:MAG: 3-keto-5-aminohexanoate cleavage protein [Firmicutes bacterium]|nr:3-keto-5-aminohexanoate cleavage protein [Bacillota bacterium]